jgi:hypothetical protein
LQLIAPEELHEIRRIWLYEKHEFDDSLPRIYEEVTGEKFPTRGDEGNALRADDWEVLREVCGDDPAFFDLQVGLLGVERQFRAACRVGAARSSDWRSGWRRGSTAARRKRWRCWADGARSGAGEAASE